MGRPSKYSPELIEAICERLSKGEPLAAICRDEGMPCHASIWNWMNDQQDVERASFVSEAIARAREAGEEQMALDCLHIADDNGKDVRILEDGREVTDADVVQRAKLRIDTRLKLLAKWNPKKWGDKQSVDMNVTTTEVEFK
jgi:transposase-like protein